MATTAKTIRFSILAAWAVLALAGGAARAQSDAALPEGVKAVWDLDKAFREKTATRERVCLSGLWRWQPADGTRIACPTASGATSRSPAAGRALPTTCRRTARKSSRTTIGKTQNSTRSCAAWYQRELVVPKDWGSRRMTLTADYVNSLAEVFVDGKRAGEIHFPGGQADLTGVCKPGGKYVLSLLVSALPLKGVMLSYSDTNSAKEVQGKVERRGLCGDVYVMAQPDGPRIADFRVQTSVRKGELALDVHLEQLAGDKTYLLAANVVEDGPAEKLVHSFDPHAFKGGDAKDGRLAFVCGQWKPDKLWDIHTPQNMYRLKLRLLEQGDPKSLGKPLDEALPAVWLPRILDRGARLPPQLQPHLPVVGPAGQRLRECGRVHLRRRPREPA